MVQRPVRQAAKRANIFIQQQQSSTPYMAQAIPAGHRSYSTSIDSGHHIPIQHHRIIVADGVDDSVKRDDGIAKSIESMHYCQSLDAYPTVVVAENPYHHILTDEHVAYRGANYIYETNYSSPYYSVSPRIVSSLFGLSFLSSSFPFKPLCLHIFLPIHFKPSRPKK